MTCEISKYRVLLMGALMVGTAVITFAVTPKPHATDARESINLQALFPRVFGRWHAIDDALPPIVGDPDKIAATARIYSQVLYRTYVNDDGAQILLTVAYGGPQTDSLAMHRPEVCYAAQGFEVTSVHDGLLKIGDGTLPVKLLAAQLGTRYEPITYWFVVGNRVVTNRMQQKFEQLKYALIGEIPDGLLIRVSSIEPDAAAAFARQEAFVGDLYAALDQDSRRWLVGGNISVPVR